MLAAAQQQAAAAAHIDLHSNHRAAGYCGRVQMADSDLIALLNGEQASPSLFGRDEEDHALLDEDGLPNDKFLEVVKAGKMIVS